MGLTDKASRVIEAPLKSVYAELSPMTASFRRRNSHRLTLRWMNSSLSNLAGYLGR